VVDAVAELLPVEVSAADDAVAVLVMIVPFVAAGLTVTTKVNEALAPEATLGFVQLTVPVPPTDGVEHAQPGAGMKETNVVFVGTTSLRLTVLAAGDPVLRTVIV
jgi:hypothetical protein